MTVGVEVVAMVVAMVGVGLGEVAVVDTVNENNTIIMILPAPSIYM